MDKKLCSVCGDEIKAGEDCDAMTSGNLDRNGDFEPNLEEPWYNFICSDCSWEDAGKGVHR